MVCCLVDSFILNFDKVITLTKIDLLKNSFGLRTCLLFLKRCDSLNKFREFHIDVEVALKNFNFGLEFVFQQRNFGRGYGLNEPRQFAVLN